MLTMGQVKDFGSRAVIHTVQVQTKEVRLHDLERFFPVPYVPMTMVPVIDDTDVLVTPLMEFLTDRHQVLRFTPPSSMIIESKFTAYLIETLSKSRDRVRCCRDHLLSRPLSR